MTCQFHLQFLRLSRQQDKSNLTITALMILKEEVTEQSTPHSTIFSTNSTLDMKNDTEETHLDEPTTSGISCLPRSANQNDICEKRHLIHEMLLLMGNKLTIIENCLIGIQNQKPKHYCHQFSSPQASFTKETYISAPPSPQTSRQQKHEQQAFLRTAIEQQDSNWDTNPALPRQAAMMEVRVTLPELDTNFRTSRPIATHLEKNCRTTRHPAQPCET